MSGKAEWMNTSRSWFAMTINRRFNRLFPRVLALLLAFSGVDFAAGEARMEIITIDSRALRNNPLHDPSIRSVEIFCPAQAINGRPLPIIYYLPGFGNWSGETIKDSNWWLKCTQRIADAAAPVILVIVDGHNRWGGSQYLNSPAQGNYADYVCDEIVATVEAQHSVPAKGVRRIIAGHSSGGFGALRLGMARQRLFDAVIALSPDSDFPTSHMPLVTPASVTNVPLAEINRLAQVQAPVPDNGDLNYALALSAAYAPCGGSLRGQFEWLYDGKGNFRPEIWQRWLDNDPLTLVLKNKSGAFSPNQSVYLEGAAQDDFKANVGARKIYEALREYPGRRTFYEPPGHHADHIDERLERGVAWVFGRPVFDIK
jgi:S-formylglutathione hydrolase FrmB